MRDEQHILRESAKFLIGFLCSLRSLLNRLARVVAPQTALRRASVKTEDVRLSLFHQLAGVLLVERESNGDESHFLRDLQELDFILENDAALLQHLVDLAVLVDVADGRPDVRDGFDSHTAQVFQHGHHVLQGIVGVHARADECIPLQRRKNVF